MELGGQLGRRHAEQRRERVRLGQGVVDLEVVGHTSSVGTERASTWPSRAKRPPRTPGLAHRTVSSLAGRGLVLARLEDLDVDQAGDQRPGATTTRTRRRNRTRRPRVSEKAGRRPDSVGAPPWPWTRRGRVGRPQGGGRESGRGSTGDRLRAPGRRPVSAPGRALTGSCRPHGLDVEVEVRRVVLEGWPVVPVDGGVAGGARGRAARAARAPRVDSGTRAAG